MILTLDNALCDWLTLTSFDHRYFHEQVLAWSQAEGVKDGKVTTNQKRMQYAGDTISTDRGTAFYGASVQGGRDHTMLQVSGELAHEALLFLAGIVNEPVCRVTRIDIQVTVLEPKGWEQIRLFNRLKRDGKSVGWQESTDGKTGLCLATVYSGSRTSERLLRVYQKLTSGGDMLLRAEGEYKGKKARAILASLTNYTVAGNLLQHLQRLGDGQLSVVFDNALHGVSSHNAKPQVKEIDKTAEWLLKSALPAFSRVINQHEGDSGVAYAFLNELRNSDIL